MKPKRYVIAFGTAAVALAMLMLPQPGNPASEQKMLEDVMKLLLGEISKLSSRITYLEQQNKTMSRMITKLMEDQDQGGRLLPEQVKDHLAKMYTLPKVVSLCNERVPIDKWDVWQRLDSEFFSFLMDQRQVILWLKRSGLSLRLQQSPLGGRTPAIEERRLLNQPAQRRRYRVLHQ